MRIQARVTFVQLVLTVASFLSRVLPPPASQRQRAVKQKIIIRRKKGKKVGKTYIPGPLVDDKSRALTVIPADNNFAGDG